MWLDMQRHAPTIPLPSRNTRMFQKSACRSPQGCEPFATFRFYWPEHKEFKMNANVCRPNGPTGRQQANIFRDLFLGNTKNLYNYGPFHRLIPWTGRSALSHDSPQVLVEEYDDDDGDLVCCFDSFFPCGSSHWIFVSSIYLCCGYASSFRCCLWPLVPGDSPKH